MKRIDFPLRRITSLRQVAPLVLLAACSAVVGRGEAQTQVQAQTPKIMVTPAKTGGVYAVGEKIAWHVALQGAGAQDARKVTYVLRRGALTEIARGELAMGLNGGNFETSLSEPGALMAEFTVEGAPGAPDKPESQTVGAVVEPAGIAPSLPEPADFGAFWQSKLSELAQVAPNPVLEAGESGDETVDYWKITLDNIRGTHIRGQLARPKATGKKLPALLIVQWAGIYPLNKEWFVPAARNGWLELNINAHDLPIDEPLDFYRQQEAGPLKNYWDIGKDDREQSYFLRMYLACYQAVEYLASRDDWDGKTLVVMGTSQGGMQSIVTAGLNPRVTAMMANVPAGCDYTAPLVGRRAGWPEWNGSDPANFDPKVVETSRYYDVVNFARHVKCPALVAAGLLDTTCPAPGVIAAYNQIEAPKKLLVMEHSDHQGTDNTQAPFNNTSAAWLNKLKDGQSPLAAPLAQ